MSCRHADTPTQAAEVVPRELQRDHWEGPTEFEKCYPQSATSCNGSIAVVFGYEKPRIVGWAKMDFMAQRPLHVTQASFHEDWMVAIWFIATTLRLLRSFWFYASWGFLRGLYLYLMNCSSAASWSVFIRRRPEAQEFVRHVEDGCPESWFCYRKAVSFLQESKAVFSGGNWFGNS